MRTRASAALCALLTFSAPLARAEEEKQEGAVVPPASPPSSPASVPAIADKPIVVWPTLTPAGDDVGGTAVHKPGPSEGSIYARALELDATLRDAVQDLGYTLDVADAGPAMGHARDLDMLERAQHSSARSSSPTDAGTWVVSARL